MKKVFIEIGGGIAGHLSFLTGVLKWHEGSEILRESARAAPKYECAVARLHCRACPGKFRQDHGA